jgi:transposase
MELKALRKHGWTISALAREFGLSRNTVKRELASDAPRHYPERDKPTKLTPSQLAHVERRLAVCPTIRGTDLHYELQRQYDYLGSYRAFSRHLMSLRPPEAKDPEIRFETGPGIQTQADWTHLGLWPLGDSMAELHSMVAILGFSRAPAIRFAIDCTRATSFERLVRCFDDLGGVTREALTSGSRGLCGRQNRAAARGRRCGEHADGLRAPTVRPTVESCDLAHAGEPAPAGAGVSVPFSSSAPPLRIWAPSSIAAWPRNSRPSRSSTTCFPAKWRPPEHAG